MWYAPQLQSTISRGRNGTGWMYRGFIGNLNAMVWIFTHSMYYAVSQSLKGSVPRLDLIISAIGEP